MGLTNVLSNSWRICLAGAAALILGCSGNNKPSRSVDYTTTMPLYGNPMIDAIGLSRVIPKEDLEHAKGELRVESPLCAAPSNNPEIADKVAYVSVRLDIIPLDPRRTWLRLETYDGMPQFFPDGRTEKTELLKMTRTGHGDGREVMRAYDKSLVAMLSSRYQDFQPDSALAGVGQSLHDYGRLRAMMHTNWRP